MLRPAGGCRPRSTALGGGDLGPWRRCGPGAYEHGVALFARVHRSTSPPEPAPAGPPTLSELVGRRAWSEALGRGAQGRDVVLHKLEELLALDSELGRNGQPRLAGWEVQPVVTALAELHEPTVTAALVKAATTRVSAEAPLTVALLEALADDGGPAATAGLVDVALGSHPDVAALAVTTLERAPSEGAVNRTLARLSDPDAEVRARAAALAARLAGAHAAPRLLPLLDDPEPAVRERAAELLAANGGADVVLPLLVAEETDCLLRRAGLSHVTFAGRLSPYLLAAARVVTGDAGVGWQLAQPLPYDAEQRLDELVATAREAHATDLAAATAALPAAAATTWGVSALTELLGQGGGPERGGALHYLDGRAYVTARERCRRLGLAVTEEHGELTTTVYGEKQELVATVTCADGALRLVADVDDVRRAEGAT